MPSTEIKRDILDLRFLIFDFRLQIDTIWHLKISQSPNHNQQSAIAFLCG